MSESSSKSIKSIIEASARWFHETHGDGELVVAKDEFLQRCGKVFSDDEPFEERMRYFMDFFVLERPSKATGVAPIIMYADFLPKHDARAEKIRKMRDFCHSVFEVKAIRKDSLKLKDLIDGRIFLVTPEQECRFYQKGEVFQGFVFSDLSVLSPAVIFHPLPVRKVVAKRLAKWRKISTFSRSAAIELYASLQLRAWRSPTIDPQRVYENAINRAMASVQA